MIKSNRKAKKNALGKSAFFVVNKDVFAQNFRAII